MVGKCSDGEIDHDGDVVSPSFMKAAVDQWLATFPAVRLQHRHDDPVGKGLEAWQDADGATWLRSLIVDDRAVKLVKSGVLAAYSVGIAEPKTRPHPKATRFEIYGGRLIEVSVCDVPSNPRCGIQIAKSVAGRPVFVGKAFRESKADKRLRKAAKLLGVPVPDPSRQYAEWLAKQAAPGPALDEVATWFLTSDSPALRGLLDQALSEGYGQQG